MIKFVTSKLENLTAVIPFAILTVDDTMTVYSIRQIVGVGSGVDNFALVGQLPGIPALL